MRQTLRSVLRSFAIVAALACVLAAGTVPAHAGGPLNLCQTGQGFLWPAGGTNIPFNPDQGDLGPLTQAQAVALVAQAFQQWGDIPTATTTYVNAGNLPVDVDITNFIPFVAPAAPDGFSAIVFDDDGQIFAALFGPGSGILGFASPEWVNLVTCDVLEGVAFLNGPAFTDLAVGLDIMVHEFGHYQNLSHTAVNGQIVLGDTSGPTPANTFPIPPLNNRIETMYPLYFGVAAGFSTPDKEDVATLSRFYPEPGFFASTATISGTIFAPNGTTPLTGVNVIARNVAAPFDDAFSALSSDFALDLTPGAPLVGTYTLRGLTPGAQYAVFVDQILAGGFSTPPLVPLPGPEEFYNGAGESGNGATDVPGQFTAVSAPAGGTASNVNVIFNAPGAGAPLPVGDDGSVQIFLPFPFNLCGQSFASVFINANGNLTFGVPSGDFSESILELLAGPPRIAGVWDDLNPGAGGSVFFNQSNNTFTVTWQNVPEFVATGSNTFSITLKKSSDHIDIDFGGLTALDGLTGVSCGGAVTSGFETESDLSSFSPSRINLHGQPAMFELFTGVGDPNDLASSTVRFNGSTNYNDNWAGPNDSLGHARNIDLPFDSIDVNRFTEIEPAGADVDYFQFEASAGTTLIAEILTGQLDTLLGLFDVATGNLIAADDDSGPGLLSRLVFAIPADGEYALAVTTFPDVDFSGDGVGGGRYVLNAFTVDGTLLTLGDDTTLNVPLGFTFPYQGGSFTSVFVNSNGNLTFGAGSTDLSESVADLLNGPPRIAGVWDDLNPAAGGLVLFNSNGTSATIRFIGVPEFLASTTNTFTFTLDASGSVTIAYDAVAALDALAGVSQGGGAANPGETNLSGGGPFPVNGTTYELFTGGVDAFDLDFQTLTFQ